MLIKCNLCVLCICSAGAPERSNISHFINVHPKAKQPSYSVLSPMIQRGPVRYNMTGVPSIHKQKWV